MTEDLYNKLQPYRDMMKAIVVNSSYSSVPFEYQELVLGTMKQRGVSLCHCPSGVINATSRLYQEALLYERAQRERAAAASDNKQTNAARRTKRNSK